MTKKTDRNKAPRGRAAQPPAAAAAGGVRKGWLYAAGALLALGQLSMLLGMRPAVFAAAALLALLVAVPAVISLEDIKAALRRPAAPKPGKAAPRTAPGSSFPVKGLLVGAVVLVLAGLGVLLAGKAWGLAFTTWAAAGGVLAWGLPSAGGTGAAISRERSALRSWEPWFLLGLLLLVAVPRLAYLDTLPKGSVQIEGQLAGRGDDLVNIEPYSPHLFDEDFAWPTLTVYEGGTFAKWFGWTVGHHRIASALWGILALLAFYFVARQATSPGTAAVASLLFAGDHLQLIVSRTFFPGTILHAAPLIGIGLTLAGLKTRRVWLFLLAGMAVGLSLHGFIPGRTLGALFMAWFVWLWMVRRQDFPGFGAMALFGLGYLITGGVVLVWAMQHPANYLQYVSRVNPNKGGGVLAYFKTLAEVFPRYRDMWHVQGDYDAQFNIPMAPQAGAVMALLLPLALGFCLARFWQPLPAFALALFVAGMLPSMLGTGFPHPTNRRLVMALPGVYLMAALALERLRLILNPERRRGLALALGGVGLILGVWGLAGGLVWYFRDWNQDTFVVANHNLRGYYAGLEMRANPKSQWLADPELAWLPFSNTVLFPRKTEHPLGIVRGVEELVALPGGQDTLICLDGAYTEAGGLLQRLYPHAGLKAYEFEPKHRFEHSLQIIPDHFRPYTYLYRITLTAKDLAEAQDLVSLPDLSRAGAFQPGFAQAHAGRPLHLAGALRVAGNGESLSLRMGWPGWSLQLDGKPWANGRTAVLDGGVHRIELAGSVPKGEIGALPFTVVNSGGVDLKPVSLRALWPVNTWRAEYHLGEKSWSKKPLVSRLELGTFLRYHDPTPVQAPFSVTMKAWLTVPEDGSYRFQAYPKVENSLELEGKRISAPYFSKLAMDPAPVPLKAGHRYAMTLLYDTGYFSPSDRTVLMQTQGPGDGDWRTLPADWITPRD